MNNTNNKGRNAESWVTPLYTSWKSEQSYIPFANDFSYNMRTN